MARNSVSISIQGDKEYVQAVKEVARKRKVQVAQIVREAVDKAIGNEVKKELGVFFASSVPQNQQSCQTKESA